MKVRRCGLVVIGVIAGSLIGVSSARACGDNNPCGLVVAHGVSPGGQRWSQTAGLNGTQLVVELSLSQRTAKMTLAGTSGPLHRPARRSFPQPGETDWDRQKKARLMGSRFGPWRGW